ncbi:MAG: FmdB family zinc ribbon protein [Anaerolineales bacterium]
MPIYEYLCLDCNTVFDALRPMAKADTPIVCEDCESEHTSRMLSVFFARSASRSFPASNGAGCACGGACSCASLN